MASRKKKTPDLQAQPDRSAPLESQALLAAAKPVLARLEKDLLARADDSTGVTEALKARHAAEKKAERTADNYATWRRNFVEQVAAAWFLSVVFVRTLEDRGLLERHRIAGEGALDNQKSFFAIAPSLSERDYLLTVFRELSHLSAAADLFDAKHNPVWLLAPSAEATQQLLQLFRTPSDAAPAFRFGGDTRFLGDLYQDVSENVRKRYALLQTPRFVESFILDQTLDPAIERFGLDEATLVDPTCGSGHFLLGAFERLLDRRLEAVPGIDVRQAAHQALDAVAGADINPYAVAIARFRLTLAFLERAGYKKLKEAPKLPIHLAVADSLLHNPQKGLEQKAKSSDEYAQTLLGEQAGTNLAQWEGELFALEDPVATRGVLGKRYAAVVGNPPYIVVKDKVLRTRYAQMYRSCSMNYSLSVPFCERMFELARDGGQVSMITANSFMKRQFGKKLIQDFLTRTNLQSVINTSGAYIPGHGTPTVILSGTAEGPVGETIQVVLANRGEPSTPLSPEDGLVWRSIAEHSQNVGFENEYISVTRMERNRLGQHPWALGGGGANELRLLVEGRAKQRLANVVHDIGFSIILGEDDVFLRRRGDLATTHLPRIPMVVGEEVRDWACAPSQEILRPFDERTLHPEASELLVRTLWPWRRILEERIVSGSTSMKSAGKSWYDVRRLSRDKHRWPQAITFAFVATHNHFVLDRGGKVFNRSAPIIKLAESATEEDHYALLAYLNSSTACFWMKQVCHNKTNASQKHSTDPARAAFEFAGTALADLPVFSAGSEVAGLAKQLSELGAERGQWLSGEAFLNTIRDAATRTDIDRILHEGWLQYDQCTARAAFLQEEIDWAFYAAAGLVKEPAQAIQAPAVEGVLGRRPFELREGYNAGVSSRASRSQRVGTDVRTRTLPCWEVRLPLLENPLIAQLESREFKRMWRDTERNVDQREFREELPAQWVGQFVANAIESHLRQAQIRSRSNVLTALDATVFEAAAEFLGVSKSKLVDNLMTDQAVPFLDVHVYTTIGLEKRCTWQETWEAQRAEDRGESAAPAVPPPYSQGSRGKSSDFRSDVYWRLRGKLDVPKERFISYPGCESDEDGEPVYGWAGWNHRQRAVALATLYTHRKAEEGWKKERLQPMLAGILELLPWLEQWHHEPDAEFDGAIPAVQFREFLDAECAEHGFTYDDLRNWRPPEKRRAASPKKKKARKAS